MALSEAGSGKNPQARVGCSGITSVLKEKKIPAFQEKVQPPLCLRCWNSAVERNYLLVICERGDVCSASC